MDQIFNFCRKYVETNDPLTYLVAAGWCEDQGMETHAELLKWSYKRLLGEKVKRFEPKLNYRIIKLQKLIKDQFSVLNGECNFNGFTGLGFHYISGTKISKYLNKDLCIPRLIHFAENSQDEDEVLDSEVVQRHLKILMVEEFTMRIHRCLNRLPPNVRSILWIGNEDGFEQLAMIAPVRVTRVPMSTFRQKKDKNNSERY